MYAAKLSVLFVVFYVSLGVLLNKSKNIYFLSTPQFKKKLFWIIKNRNQKEINLKLFFISKST